MKTTQGYKQNYKKERWRRKKDKLRQMWTYPYVVQDTLLCSDDWLKSPLYLWNRIFHALCPELNDCIYCLVTYSCTALFKLVPLDKVFLKAWTFKWTHCCLVKSNLSAIHPERNACSVSQMRSFSKGTLGRMWYFYRTNKTINKQNM